MIVREDWRWTPTGWTLRITYHLRNGETIVREPKTARGQPPALRTFDQCIDKYRGCVEGLRRRSASHARSSCCATFVARPTSARSFVPSPFARGPIPESDEPHAPRCHAHPPDRRPDDVEVRVEVDGMELDVRKLSAPHTKVCRRRLRAHRSTTPRRPASRPPTAEHGLDDRVERAVGDRRAAGWRMPRSRQACRAATSRSVPTPADLSRAGAKRAALCADRQPRGARRHRLYHRGDEAVRHGEGGGAGTIEPSTPTMPRWSSTTPCCFW